MHTHEGNLRCCLLEFDILLNEIVPYPIPPCIRKCTGNSEISCDSTFCLHVICHTDFLHKSFSRKVQFSPSVVSGI